MKRFLVALMLVFCTTLMFAEEFVIKTGDSFNVFKVGNIEYKLDTVTEILPVENDMCKVIFGSKALYLKKNDTLHLDYCRTPLNEIVSAEEGTISLWNKGNEDWIECSGLEAMFPVRVTIDSKVTSFTYNEITTEIIK